jgi:hypothetical protein
MKQIPFNADLIDTPGITVKYRDGSTPDFVKVYDGHIRTIHKEGDCFWHKLATGSIGSTLISKYDLLMYRSPRTAEEVARELPFFDLASPIRGTLLIDAVQAGMDEAGNQNPTP